MSKIDELADAVASRLAASREPDPVKKSALMRAISSAHAPAYNRTGRGEKGLLVSNIFRAIASADWSQATEERAMSDRLAATGISAGQGSILFPFFLASLGDAHRDLQAEITQKMALDVDPGELAWTLKRFPEVARAFGLKQKDLEIGDDTLGGILVPVTQAPRIIDFLRARSVCVAAGAQEVPLPPTGNISYPRLSADPTFTWTDPDTTTDATPSTPAFGIVRLIAKSLRGFVTIPNDLIRYSTPAVELIVRAALGGKAAVAEDNQFLEGVGSTLAPRGLLYYPRSAAETSTIGMITYHVAGTVGANGDTLAAEDPALIQGLFEDSNDPDPATGWIMRSLLWANLINRRSDSVSAGDAKGPFMFWTSRGDVTAGVRKALMGVPVFTTTNITNNLVKGTGTTLHPLLYGNFGRMLIGRSGALELAASEHIKFLQDKTVIKAILRSDMGLEHEQSFVLTMNLLQQ